MSRYLGHYRVRELRAQGQVTIPAPVVARLIAARCEEGRHVTETDAETGNEICRHCGVVVDL